MAFLGAAVVPLLLTMAFVLFIGWWLSLDVASTASDPLTLLQWWATCHWSRVEHGVYVRSYFDPSWCIVLTVDGYARMRMYAAVTAILLPLTARLTYRCVDASAHHSLRAVA